MNERIKNVVTGAAVQLIPKSASNMGSGYLSRHGQDPKAVVPWWYAEDFGLPRDDLVLDLALPAVLGVAGAVKKDQKLKDMAIGAGLTGLATFLSVFFVRSWQYPIPFGTQTTASYTPPGNVQQRPQPSQHSSNGTLWV